MNINSKKKNQKSNKNKITSTVFINKAINYILPHSIQSCACARGCLIWIFGNENLISKI